MLHLGEKNQKHRYILGYKWLGGMIIEKGLGGLVDQRLNMNHQFDGATEILMQFLAATTGVLDVKHRR